LAEFGEHVVEDLRVVGNGTLRQTFEWLEGAIHIGSPRRHHSEVELRLRSLLDGQLSLWPVRATG
jgi:hypothetical protein